MNDITLSPKMAAMQTKLNCPYLIKAFCFRFKCVEYVCVDRFAGINYYSSRSIKGHNDQVCIYVCVIERCN